MVYNSHSKGMASATGKVILSGEHAVVFGAPALAVGTACKVRTEITASPNGLATFDLSELDVHLEFSTGQLEALFDRLTRNYQSFLDGSITVDEILRHPVELMPFAFASAWDQLSRPSFNGVRVTMDFGIPIGCGMGSSAALGISVLKATGHFFQKPLSQDDLFELSMGCERLMHGHPSGVDSNVSLYGGAFHFRNGHLEPRPIPAWTYQLFNTGRPESSTGECVESVRSRFTSSDSIWEEFTAVTEALDGMLDDAQPDGLLDHIRKNHELLCRIGVVPDRVRRAIQKVEDLGGAAKVTGAGAVRGENAGAILVFGDVNPTVLSEFGITRIEGC